MNGPIVVGTDGSDTAKVAVTAAIALAKSFAQPLHVVSAYQPQASSSANLPNEYRNSVFPHSRVEAVLAAAAGQVRLAGVKVRTHAKIGNAAEAILDVAEDVGADLIVVGNRGIDSKTRFVIGNVPSRVVHHATCSTFVVNTRGDDQ